VRLCFLILALLLSVLPCRAEELDIPGADEFWRQAEDYGVTEGDGLERGLARIVPQALEQALKGAGSGLSTALKLLSVVLLCAVAKSVSPDGRAAELAGALAITALTMTDMAAMIGLGRDTMGKMDAFSQLLLPVIAVLTAATGGVTAAAARQGATVLFSQALIFAMDRMLVPMVYAFVGASCAAAAVDNPGLKKLAGLMKGTITFLLTAFLLIFVGYLTASGAIAGSVDASAVKAAKLAISRAIPVVGSILADASESVLAGAGILRSTVGAAGMLVVLAICLTPFFRLALQYLTYKMTAALCAMAAQPRLSQLIDAIGGAFGLTLGMTGAGALVLLVSVVSAVSAVTP